MNKTQLSFFAFILPISIFSFPKTEHHISTRAPFSFPNQTPFSSTEAPFLSFSNSRNTTATTELHWPWIPNLIRFTTPRMGSTTTVFLFSFKPNTKSSSTEHGVGWGLISLACSLFSGGRSWILHAFSWFKIAVSIIDSEGYEAHRYGVSVRYRSICRIRYLKVQKIIKIIF